MAEFHISETMSVYIMWKLIVVQLHQNGAPPEATLLAIWSISIPNVAINNIRKALNEIKFQCHHLHCVHDLPGWLTNAFNVINLDMSAFVLFR